MTLFFFCLFCVLAQCHSVILVRLAHDLDEPTSEYDSVLQQSPAQMKSRMKRYKLTIQHQKDLATIIKNSCGLTACVS